MNDQPDLRGHAVVGGRPLCGGIGKAIPTDDGIVTCYSCSFVGCGLLAGTRPVDRLDPS